jgi:hypothetical protein
MSGNDQTTIEVKRFDSGRRNGDAIIHKRIVERLVILALEWLKDHHCSGSVD